MVIQRSPNPERRAGFTLLELLVVLALIGLFSALALPRIAGSVPGLQLKTSARKVVSILRHARGRAVTEQEAFGVRFDPAEGRVSVVTAVRPGDADPPPPGSLEAFVLPEDILLRTPRGTEGAPNVIGFYPAGGSNGGEIELSTPGDRRMRITVAVITGKIAIVDEEE